MIPSDRPDPVAFLEARMESMKEAARKVDAKRRTRLEKLVWTNLRAKRMGRDGIRMIPKSSNQRTVMVPLASFSDAELVAILPKSVRVKEDAWLPTVAGGGGDQDG